MPRSLTLPDELDTLLRLQARLYADDPGWVAPLRPWLARRLDRRGAFFREAELVGLAVERDGEVAGVCTVLRDRRHEEVKGEAAAFFGFFECVEDEGVARELLDGASEIARGWGARVLRGPRNLTRVEEVGFLVEGFGTRPPMLTGHHPPYYARFAEALGFAQHHDVLAYDVALYADGRPRPLPQALAEKAAAVDVPGLAVRPVRPLGLGGDLDRCHAVFVEAFRDVPDNTPMPRAQFVSLARIAIALAGREMMQIATVGDRVAGFALTFPELNEVIGAAKGSLSPAGIARMLGAWPRRATASFKLIGVLPEHRGSGLHALLIREAIEGIRRAGYTRLEASLIDERNSRMRRVVEDAGMAVYRRYRIFERTI
ncbi:MAG: GNAT family N-acetyltransferase [Myxococcota bacterium]